MGLIVATAPTELRALPTHDAWFDADHVVHDEQKRTLTIPFAQEPEPTPDAPAAQLVRKRRFWAEYRAPVVGWRLTIFAVRAVHRPELWGEMGMLLGVSYDGRRRTVAVYSDDRLDVAVDALRVEALGGTEVVGWVRNTISLLSECGSISCSHPSRTRTRCGSQRSGSPPRTRSSLASAS